ncbi:hypothetical protein FisN_18Lh135 [Fistulifera solaris]|uniref:DUF6824 domain-containing protein n=1 Tax=Fistulifera solaris TaxID=1519565 RepID=A0A1Z5KEZ1_FISSO|nr:hypothetical protein FisN_18Lh135 [Fistulifera solaris]|eukprot:GAX24787.1 hypothetical protein FisN_18Lh135 [Fistulifera solaris]
MESSVSSLDHPLPLTDIEELTAHDVLCGRGVTTNKWAGNEQFRSLVGLNKELYVTSTKRQKMAISRSIVDAVRSMNPPGRFLEKNMDTGLWNDIGNRKAIEKTSQALRDGAATLRKQLSADLGDPEFLSAVFDMEAATRNKAASPAASKEKEKVVKAKPNVKKGIRRTMSSPDVASSTTMKEKSVMKRAIKRMDTSDSSSELHPPPRQSHSNPTSPREGRYAHNMYRGGPYPHQFPPLQVEFSGPRGFLDCVSDYPMCGNHYRPYDAGYENYDSHRPPWYPGAPPYPRAYPPPPHPNRAPFSPPSYDSQYWRHPPSSPAGSVRSAGTVRSSPAALPEYDRRPIHPPYPYQHHPPPPYYPRNSSQPQLYVRQRLEGSVSPLSGSHPASLGDFTPPMSPHSDRIPKREETILTARSPDDVAFHETEVMEDSFGFEVVLRERDEAAFDISPIRNDLKQPGNLYFSYTKNGKDDPAQISHEEDHTSPFRYDDDDHGSTSFMMDIADDLLLEPIAPVGPMDEMQVIGTSPSDGM